MQRSLIHPRFWPTWLGIGLLRVIAVLPFSTQLFIGRRIGDLMYLLTPGRRQVAHINLKLCFPELDAAEHHSLLRRSFQSTGISLTEIALCWWGSSARLQRLYRAEGIEHLDAALQQGKGALLLGGHYSTLEISGRLCSFHCDELQPIYKPARNDAFDAVMKTSRKRVYDDVLSNREMRTIVRRLKSNKAVWYAPDQDFGRAQTVFAPFMGIQAASLTMTSRLAKLSGSPVLPFYSQRLPGTQGFLIRVMPPLENFPSGDDVADATQINQAIEQQVRAAPEQYNWLHRRFKTRPPGEEPIYPPK